MTALWFVLVGVMAALSWRHARAERGAVGMIKRLRDALREGGSIDPGEFMIVFAISVSLVAISVGTAVACVIAAAKGLS